MSVFTDPEFLVDIVGIERSEENRGQKSTNTLTVIFSVLKVTH